MYKTRTVSLELVAEHRVDPVYPYLPTGNSPSRLLSSRFAALEVAVTDITLHVASIGGPVVESVAVEMLELQSRFCEQDAEVHGLEGRLCQRDADVKNLRRQVQEIVAQVHEAELA